MLGSGHLLARARANSSPKRRWPSRWAQSVEDIALTIHPHPTLVGSTLMGKRAYAFYGRTRRIRSRRRRRGVRYNSKFQDPLPAIRLVAGFIIHVKRDRAASFHGFFSLRRATSCFKGREISLFAAGDEAFGGGFQFFPAGANLLGLVVGDLVVGGGDGDDLQEVGKFLDDLVGRRDQEGAGERRVLRD